LLLAAATNHLNWIGHRRTRYRNAAGRNYQPALEDVDFSQKVLFVTRSKTPEGESREIPLTERLHTLLLEHRKTQRPRD